MKEKKIQRQNPQTQNNEMILKGKTPKQHLFFLKKTHNIGKNKKDERRYMSAKHRTTKAICELQHASKCHKQKDSTLTTKKPQAQTVLQMNFPNLFTRTLQNISLKADNFEINFWKLLLPEIQNW